MEKLPMCRICLVKNVRMHEVVNKNLHELYEKLTDIPFVTEDRRPILACFVCCAQLKKCYQIQKKCLEAEELFAQMLNEDYEPKPLINQDHLEVAHGFIICPTVSISISEVGQTDSVVVKEELPAVCERQDDILVPKEERLSDDVTRFTTPRAPVAKKPKLPTRRTKLEDTISAESKKADSKIIQNPQSHTSKPVKPVTDTRPRVQNSINNTAVDIDCPTNSNQDFSCKVRHNKGSGSNGESYKCDVCQRSFSRKCSLIKHISIHTGEKPYTCDVCQRSFRNKYNLTQHTTIHSGVKPYKCDVCQRSFRLKGDHTVHIRTHTGEKPYTCDVCQRSFRNKYNLTQHTTIHSGVKPYKCDVCQRSFRRKGDYTAHIRTHTGEKLYECDICQRSFSKKDNLRIHIRLHTGEKPYTCDVCQRSFRLKGDHTVHTRTHTGEKPYKCDICHSGFRKNSYLTNHIRIRHSRSKSYKCEVCQRRFTTKSGLTIHIRTHTGEKPYKCDVCQHSFGQICNLTRHVRIHTGEKPYKCDLCQCAFTHLSSFKKHFGRVHPSE